MRTRLPLLIALILPVLANAAEPPALPRGLGFRVAGQRDTPAQVWEDVRLIRQALLDTTFDAGLKSKLEALLAAAAAEVKAAETPADAARAFDGADRAAAALLSADERAHLKRHALIVVGELMMLNGGFSAEDVNDRIVAEFRLTPDQAKQIRTLLGRLHADARDAADDAKAGTEPLTAEAARRAIRALLTADQRKALDEKIMAGIKAAAAESAAPKKGEAP